MGETSQPIGWLALAEGTRVVSVDGREIGRVAEVIGDHDSNIFSGLVLRTGLLGTDRFVPAEQVGKLTSDEVRLKITALTAEKLEPYEG